MKSGTTRSSKALGTTTQAASTPWVTEYATEFSNAPSYSNAYTLTTANSLI